ncbi:MAG: hypothetical protein CME71_11015, partial [Halobacteriovorax sp.]|nr:hypothetical protein [Halobacteriovorax sp.]
MEKSLDKIFARLTFMLAIAAMISSCGDTSVESEGFTEAKLAIESPLVDTLRTTTKQHTVTIRNIGDKAASAMLFSFTDPNTYLTYTGGSYPGTTGTCAIGLNPGESCTIDLTFQPFLAGEFEATATLKYFTGAEIATLVEPLPLKGNTEAQLEFQYAPSYDFGTHNAGSPSGPTLILVSNTGETQATLMTGSITAPFEFFGSGTYPGSPATCGSTLEPAATCLIQVFFNTPVSPVGNFIENVSINFFDGLVMSTDSLQLEALNQSFVTILSPLDSTYINANNTAALTISGTCSQPATPVNLAINAFNFATTCSGTSTWSMTLDLTSLAEGAVTVTATHSSATPDSISMTKDSILPTPAPTSANWVQTSPYNSNNVTATWTPSTDPDVVSQTIRFYSNSGCSTSLGADATLSPGTSSYPYSAPGDGNYYYQITATDDANNRALTPCSSLMRVDTTAPAAPTALSWLQASPQRILPVTSSWALSASADVTTQIIRYYSNSSCTTPTGTVNTIGGGASTNNFSPATSGTYYFTITAQDAATNATTSACVASAMVIDIDPPAAPTSIGWSTSSPTNNSSVVSQWNVSASSDVATQSISFFSDAACSVSAGATIPLTITDNSYSFTGSDGISYYYYVTVADSAGNAANSSCSPVLRVDLTPPANATTLSFVETSPYSGLAFNGTWTASVDAELTSQSIQLYQDGTCTAVSGAPVSLGAAATTTTFGGTNGTTYSYRITSTDLAGNSSTSGCSSSILLDTTPPVAAASLSWIQGTYHNNVNVTSSWTPSTSTDKASQSISYYSDASCSTLVSGPTTLGSVSTNTNAFTGVNGSTYYYQITTVDQATNTTISACSNPMTIDTVAPAAPTITGWTQATPTASANINANWNLSVATDIDFQEITFYSDAACTIATLGPVTKTNVAVTHAYTPGSDGTYYYQVRAVDLASNATLSSCSAGLLVDTTAPVAASTLNWVQTSPFAGTSVDATWTLSPDSNLASQEIAYFTDPTCTTASGGTIALSNAVTTNAFAGINGTTYYYRINSIDHVGNSTQSACSAPMRLDTTPPNAATALAWVETTPSNVTTVNTTWTPSVSGDVSNQTIIYYTESTCTTAEGTTQNLAAAASTHNFNGADGNSYYYRITTRDNAGNTSLSTCSAVMSIDTTPPSAPTALAWAQTSPYNATGINATWTLSASGDVASQRISFYQDNVCTTPTGGSPITLSNAITTHSFTGVDASTYYFNILVTDTAGNTNTTACSPAMAIDTTPPVAANTLGWLEGAGSNSPNVNASWTKSTSGDLNTQTVTYYTDPGCTIAESTVNVV